MVRVRVRFRVKFRRGVLMVMFRRGVLMVMFRRGLGLGLAGFPRGIKKS